MTSATVDEQRDRLRRLYVELQKAMMDADRAPWNGARRARVRDLETMIAAQQRAIEAATKEDL